jgi:hypothetical protein
LGGEGYGNVRLFGLSDGAFDSYMIYFSVVISALSLGVKVGVGASGDCEDCAMGGDGIRLLGRLLDLWQRWISFGLELRVGVIWH